MALFTTKADILLTPLAPADFDKAWWESPQFPFIGGTTFSLRVDPHQSQPENVGWVGMYLLIRNRPPNINLTVRHRITLHSPTGADVVNEAAEWVFRPGVDSSGWCHFVRSGDHRQYCDPGTNQWRVTLDVTLVKMETSFAP
ncbi:hypothetical protein Pelo_7657 [Pelomyxa schiedti]|nr:hypothetical protein Pelo_7657 [Pelomyxa schiedti]